jgi:hypothetical protein
MKMNSQTTKSEKLKVNQFAAFNFSDFIVYKRPSFWLSPSIKNHCAIDKLTL